MVLALLGEADGGAEFIFCLPMIEKEPELQ